MSFRRGTVSEVEDPGPPARIRVGDRPAISYGPVEVGDDVVVNTAAVDLGLGSGGFDIVHVNLTRGLDQPLPDGAHVMKLNYTSLQHPVHPVESAERGEVKGAVAVIALHGQLAPVVWQARQRLPDARIGYVQTWGGALPGSFSRVARALRDQGLLAGHITAGAASGGEHEAISAIGAIHAALDVLGWDAAVVGPGPGIIGSDTALGHGGMAALESAQAALALGIRPLIVPRMSSGDPRERHRGLSHHTRTVLDLLPEPVLVAVPENEAVSGRHQAISVSVDFDLYRGSGLPATTMGRGIDEDELFFRAALAGGAVLAEEIDVVRAGRD